MQALVKTGKIQFSNTNVDAPDLHCPRCGAPNLHHLGVTVFDRVEDSPSVVRIAVDGPKVVTELVANANSGNPSSRRHGLAIQFWCEGCSWVEKSDDVIELTIAQHKGSTEMGWRFNKRE